MNDENKNIEPTTPSQFNAINYVSTNKDTYDKIKKLAEYYLGIEPTSNSKS